MSHHFEMATDNRGETVYDKHKLLDLGKMYMAELNERLDKQAREAGLAGLNEMAGANLIGGTTRPTRLARPAGLEEPEAGAEHYGDERREAEREAERE